MRHDRDDVLARTDLAALADEVLGPHRGRGISATWPCPEPAHTNQTGRTPPVSLFRSPSGTERWRCHACGAGGTAADLVMAARGVDFADALDLLARRAGLGSDDGRPPAPPPRAMARAVEPAAAVSEEIERYVAACQAHLWSPAGGRVRHWLSRRGLGEEVLRANRVGADPGPTAMARPVGLPWRGPAAVFPVLGPDGRAVYLQARYLHPPGGRKYDNPTAALAGPSPRAAAVRTPGEAADPAAVLVCEGLPDALVAAQAGWRAAAVLGAGLPDGRVASSLVSAFPTERLVVAFDADGRGRDGAARLLDALGAAGAGHRAAALAVPGPCGDLNGWLVMSGGAFGDELGAAARGATPGVRVPADDLGLRDQLEAIRYRHILGAAPAVAARNLGLVRRFLARPGPGLSPSSDGVARRSALVDDLDVLAYRHLLGDDAPSVGRKVAAARAVVEAWAERPAGRPRDDRWTALARSAAAAVALDGPGQGVPAPGLEIGR